jgi:Zn-dependent membrane protease YugP
MNKDSSREHMSRARVTLSWMIFIVMILLSANSFFKSGGESINAWALLLLIPLPLSLIISERIKEQKIEQGNLEQWDEESEESLSEQKEADNPLETGFDIPIL